MPTTQTEFRNFERQYAAIRAANRDARREGVGLLTPKLLKEHIDSGKDLVLAYGRKGLTVSYTPAELKQFVEAQRKAKGHHKANVAGVALMQLENSSSRPDHANAANIRAATLYKVNGNLLYFRVTASGETPKAPSHYLVRIRLEEWHDMLTETGPYLMRAKRACVGRLSIDCGCGRHQYWYRYLATIGGFAVGPPLEKDFPKIKNPKLTGCCCKHILKTLKVLKGGGIHLLLAKELERQAGTKGYMVSQGRRFLKGAELETAKRLRGSEKADPDALAAFQAFNKARDAFAKKISEKDMQKKINEMMQGMKVRNAENRALKAALNAEKARAAKQAAADQRMALVQRIKDALQLADTFGLDRNKALKTFAEKTGVAPKDIEAIIKEEGL